MQRLMPLQDNLLAAPINDRILDFIHVQYDIKLPSGAKLEGEEAIRASHLSQKLKNMIMSIIVKNR